jgi:ferredoxin
VGLVPDLDERTSLACGPGGLLDALEAHHTARGLTLATEQFRATRIVAGEGGTVSFDRLGTDVEGDGTRPILDIAEDAGVLMPSGCRMGICYGCVLPLKEGSVRDLRTGAITTAVPGEGPAIKVQTCIHAAAGDCHLDH